MKRISGGFTIIEVMLFLGVSGALAAGILVTVGGTIGAQRYRSAVDSLTSFIQGEYSKTTNVQNDTSVHNSCNVSNDGANIAINNGARTASGTSFTCLIVGRFITGQPTSGSVTTLTTKPIYMAVRQASLLDQTVSTSGDYNFLETAANSSPIAGVSKVALLRAIDNSTTSDTYTLDWGTKIDSSKTVVPFSIAIVRSPVSGAIHTYYANSSSITGTIRHSNLKKSTICVDPNGWRVGGNFGISIERDAATESAVNVVSEGC